MKFITQIKAIRDDLEPTGTITLEVDKHSLNKLKTLSHAKKYSVEIKELSNKRTLMQNNYLWGLVREIDIAMNGKPTDEIEVYCYLLERANISFEYIGALEETEDMLKKVFRLVRKIKKIDLNGKDGYMYKCFLGSSKLDTKEMALLIDTALDVALENDVENIGYWYEVLR